MALLAAAAFTACGNGDNPGNSKAVSYEGAALSDGMVGVAYTASVATATGADGIAYALKEGSALPAGLSLSGGSVSGNPTAAGEFTFTITASAAGATSADAAFTVTIAARQAGMKEYIMEAEFIDLLEKYGSGWSNTSREYDMVIKDAAASNGYYLAFLTTPDMEFTWSFDSDADGTGAVAFSMVSEYGPQIALTGVTFKINGTVTPYPPFTINGPLPAAPSTDFVEYFFSTNFPIRAGANTVSLLIRTNDWFPGRNGGPTVDYMKIISELDLTFNQHVQDNEELAALRGE